MRLRMRVCCCCCCCCELKMCDILKWDIKIRGFITQLLNNYLSGENSCALRIGVRG